MGAGERLALEAELTEPELTRELGTASGTLEGSEVWSPDSLPAGGRAQAEVGQGAGCQAGCRSVVTRLGHCILIVVAFEGLQVPCPVLPTALRGRKAGVLGERGWWSELGPEAWLPWPGTGATSSSLSVQWEVVRPSLHSMLGQALCGALSRPPLI